MICHDTCAVPCAVLCAMPCAVHVALCCAGVSVYFTAEEVSEGTCRHPREENSSEETDTAFTPTQLLEEK